MSRAPRSTPFSAWHAFVTFFALAICLRLIGFAAYFIEISAGKTGVLIAAWATALLLAAATGYLARDLWRNLRLLWTARDEESR